FVLPDVVPIFLEAGRGPCAHLARARGQGRDRGQAPRMKEVLRAFWVLLLGVLVLVVKSSWLADLVIAPLDPHPLVPMVVYLAIAPNISVSRGMITSFLLGYLGDVFQGS